ESAGAARHAGGCGWRGRLATRSGVGARADWAGRDPGDALPAPADQKRVATPAEALRAYQSGKSPKKAAASAWKTHRQKDRGAFPAASSLRIALSNNGLAIPIKGMRYQ